MIFIVKLRLGARNGSGDQIPISIVDCLGALDVQCYIGEKDVP